MTRVMGVARTAFAKERAATALQCTVRVASSAASRSAGVRWSGGVDVSVTGGDGEKAVGGLGAHWGGVDRFSCTVQHWFSTGSALV